MILVGGYVSPDTAQVALLLDRRVRRAVHAGRRVPCPCGGWVPFSRTWVPFLSVFIRRVPSYTRMKTGGSSFPPVFIRV